MGSHCNVLSLESEEQCILSSMVRTVYLVFYFFNIFCCVCTVPELSDNYVLPSLAVDDGAILDIQFTDFSYPPPDGYDHIMFEKNLL